jgi:hypothetical protein
MKKLSMLSGDAEAVMDGVGVDGAAVGPWGARQLAPDEELMAREDGGEGREVSREFLVEQVLAFLFAGGDARDWQGVARRGLALLRHFAPAVLQGRDVSEVERFGRGSAVEGGFGLGDLLAGLEEGEEWQRRLRGLLEHLFPPGRDWLVKGTKRVFCVAKAYRPELVSVVEPNARREGTELGRRELSFEALARVFGEKPQGARARWSALADRVVKAPVRAVGGHPTAQFSKSEEARGKMRRSAMGNQNRRRGK